jgi:hypothetical protein
MTTTSPVTTLRRAFGALTDAQLGRLDWHRKNKTPICCGPSDWTFYTDGRGGG